MRHLIEDLGLLLAVVAWVFGIAVAKGGWWIAGAVFMPPLAWVLVAKRLLELWGVA